MNAKKFSLTVFQSGLMLIVTAGFLVYLSTTTLTTRELIFTSIMLGGPVCILLFRSHVSITQDEVSGPSKGFGALLGQRATIPLEDIDQSRSLEYVPWTPFRKCVIQSKSGKTILVPNFIGKDEFNELKELIKNSGKSAA